VSCFRIKILAVLFLLGAIVARAETDVWLDGFETNAGTNWTTNKVWQVGSPTTGPTTNAAGYRAYDGSRCATTGLKGNAPANVDSRLICTNYNGQPYLAVPSANLYPRLRFWQWFSFANALGIVEVQPQGSTNWQAISTTNRSVGGTMSTGGGWTRPALDLSAFAGTNIQVAFHFVSGIGGYGNDLGWYVDDVALVTGTPVFNNPENFEGGLGDWVVDNGSWQVGKPTSGPNAAYSGTNCAGTVLAGNYPENADSRLISPPFTVPPSNSPALHFWQWYQFDNADAFVEVSSAQVLTNYSYMTNFLTATNIDYDTNVIIITNFDSQIVYQTNVATFTNLDIDTFIYGTSNALSTNTLTFTNINTGTNVILLTNNPVEPEFYPQTNVYIFTNFNQFGDSVSTNIAPVTNAWQTISPVYLSTGSAGVNSGGWSPVSLDLSSFEGQTLRVAFHFQSGINVYGSGPGWYIDNVSVTTSPILTVPTNQTILAGQIFTTTATATNSLEPDATYAFSFAARSTNAIITTNGVITWTNTTPAIGTNILVVVAADTNSPPVLVTNSFTVTVVPAYSITMPSNQTIIAGQTFTTIATATNSLIPDTVYTFSFATHSTNAIITTNGVITWTNISPAFGANILSVVVTDTNPPPVRVTNSFTVTVVPAYSFSISNAPVRGKPFVLALHSRTNLIWQVQASSNLFDWQSVWTNSTLKSGIILYTDLWTTNFPERFYRAVYP
jgi:ABC-type uncharacterized transport system auxiliary subunit